MRDNVTHCRTDGRACSTRHCYVAVAPLTEAPSQSKKQKQHVRRSTRTCSATAPQLEHVPHTWTVPQAAQLCVCSMTGAGDEAPGCRTSASFCPHRGSVGIAGAKLGLAGANSCRRSGLTVDLGLQGWTLESCAWLACRCRCVSASCACTNSISCQDEKGESPKQLACYHRGKNLRGGQTGRGNTP